MCRARTWSERVTGSSGAYARVWAAVAVVEAAHLSVCDEILYATLAPTAARSMRAALQQAVATVTWECS
eukprot:2658662-Prymnesium_polylepis.1